MIQISKVGEEGFGYGAIIHRRPIESPKTMGRELIIHIIRMKKFLPENRMWAISIVAFKIRTVFPKINITNTF